MYSPNATSVATSKCDTVEVPEVVVVPDDLPRPFNRPYGPSRKTTGAASIRLQAGEATEGSAAQTSPGSNATTDVRRNASNNAALGRFRAAWHISSARNIEMSWLANSDGKDEIGAKVFQIVGRVSLRLRPSGDGALPVARRRRGKKYLVSGIRDCGPPSERACVRQSPERPAVEDRACRTLLHRAER
ncbi:hypothetical protein OH77DRAFT_479010 [Trametes cingulata]|nr:hypothetical protein OH77DRAFT_479010 [Trametes cingulata]